MNKIQKPVPWLSGCLATLVALFIIAVVLPNCDLLIIDHAFDPPRIYIQPQPQLVCFYLAVTFIPVLCIFILSRRWKFFGWLGWSVLACFLAATLTM